jgi:F-type H+-transporting ATPase subunit a
VRLSFVIAIYSGLSLFFIPAILQSQDTQHNEHSQQDPDEHYSLQDGETHSGSHDEPFRASEFIMDHIKDSHEWHILTTPDGHHVSIPLPVILYSKRSGFHLFSSKQLAHGHTYRGFQMGHGTLDEKSLEGRIVEMNEHGEMVGVPLDFSITKNVFMMMLSVIMLIWVFLGLARTYKRRGISAPKGLQSFLEPLIVFIEDDVAKPNLGQHNYQKYMPYLLTVFFFILLNNVMGLIPFFPFGANVTGNIAVTMVLAAFTLLITTFSGNKAYWLHLFKPPGVPVWLAPIMFPVELIGILTKPFALMIRLFANITAGHIIVLSLISMIFIFKSLVISVPSLIMVVFMDMIELLVAFLQAYIFTILSALFIGLAMPEHQHD